MRFFLKRLQEDQEDMLALIKQREKVRSTGLAEPDLPALKIPKPAVDWDLPGTPPQRIQPAAVDAFVQAAASTAQESEVPEQESVAPAAISASGQSVKPVVKTSRAPAQSRFAGAAAAAASAAVRTSDAPLQDARQFSSAEDTAAGTGSTIAGKAGTAQPADPPQFERGTQGGPAATPAEAAARKKQEQNAKAAAKKREDEEVQTASRKKKEQELQAAVKKKEQDAEAVARKKKEQDAEAVARKKKDQDAEAVARKKKDQEVADSKRQAAKASTGSQLAHGAVDRAAALNAESDDDEEEGEEDVQLSAEEMGFPTDTGDAFAALKAKMQVLCVAHLAHLIDAPACLLFRQIERLGRIAAKAIPVRRPTGQATDADSTKLLTCACHTLLLQGYACSGTAPLKLSKLLQPVGTQSVWFPQGYSREEEQWQRGGEAAQEGAETSGRGAAEG